MILTAYVFSKLKTAKVLVRAMSEKGRFRTPFDKKHVKGSQPLGKSA